MSYSKSVDTFDFGMKANNIYLDDRCKGWRQLKILVVYTTKTGGGGGGGRGKYQLLCDF